MRTTPLTLCHVLSHECNVKNMKTLAWEVCTVHKEGSISSEEVALPIDSPARKATQVDFFII